MADPNSPQPSANEQAQAKISAATDSATKARINWTPTTTNGNKAPKQDVAAGKKVFNQPTIG